MAEKNKIRKWNLLPWKRILRRLRAVFCHESNIYELFQCWRSFQLILKVLLIETGDATSAEMQQQLHEDDTTWCILSKNPSLSSGVSLGNDVTHDCYQQTGSKYFDLDMNLFIYQLVFV